MSGGHFDYAQHRIRDIAESVLELIEKNGNKKEQDKYEYLQYGDEYHYEYPEDIIDYFKEAYKALRIAEVYAQRIDWLVSGDDGEDSFRRRIVIDFDDLSQDIKRVLKKLKKENK
jgi:hypothetical protein